MSIFALKLLIRNKNTFLSVRPSGMYLMMSVHKKLFFPEILMTDFRHVMYAV